MISFLNAQKAVKTNKTIIVPMNGSKDMPKGTFFAILKQAGIDKTDV